MWLERCALGYEAALSKQLAFILWNAGNEKPAPGGFIFTRDHATAFIAAASIGDDGVVDKDLSSVSEKSIIEQSNIKNKPHRAQEITIVHSEGCFTETSNTSPIPRKSRI